MAQKTTPTKPRPRRWLVAAALAFASLVAPTVSTAAVAAPAIDDNVWIGHKQGHGGTGVFPIYLQTPADPANPGEPDFWAYCIEHDIPAQVDRPGGIGDPSDYLGNNYYADPVVQGKVLWVLAHSYPAISLEDLAAAAGVESISRYDAIEATQYAVWRYTELTSDANWNWAGSDDEAATEAVYWHLINDANANAGLTPADRAATVAVTAPSGSQVADSLVGPFVVNTNQAVASVTVDPAATLTDDTGAAIDPTAVVDGQEIYLDLRDSSVSGTATLTATVSGSSVDGLILSVSNQVGGDATGDDHAQTLELIAAAGATTSAQATVTWDAIATPAIGTTLRDFADDDKVLPWNGGTAVDTVSYSGLTPGSEYRLEGELMRKSDGTPTGIVASTVFTPTESSGTVDVTFTIPEGFAGQSLVAFEYLFETGLEGAPLVAEHADINDEAQTVFVEKAPVKPGTDTPKPATHLANTGGARIVPLVTVSALLMLVGAGIALSQMKLRA